MTAQSPTTSGNGPVQGGFAWIGDMTEVSVHALYAACHSLRFTGRLELRDETHEAKVIFLGGDPVEIDGGDTQMIALWHDGQFRAVQCLPNLSGELTNALEQTGSLAVTQGRRLLAWVSEYRLTCDLAIERPGEKANLVFKNGQLESASVNGKDEMAALARVQAWTDGFYRVSLRPLFAAGIIALAPPPTEGAAPLGRDFDLSRSIPLNLKSKASLVVEAGPSITVSATDGSIEAEREAQRKKASGHPAPVSAAAQPAARAAVVLAPPPPKSSGAVLVVSALLVVGAATLAVLYARHLPPFSPLPKPPEAMQPPDEPVAKPAIEKPSEPTPEKPVVAATEKPSEPTPPTPSEPASTPKKSDTTQLEPKSPTPPVLPTESGADARLIEKGRLLLIEGHPHSAIELYRKAEQLNPSNKLPHWLELQALGKLGRGDLQLEGRGHVMLDGKRFDTPRKLKLFAGPHLVDTGAGTEEILLKKNEHKKLRVRP